MALAATLRKSLLLYILILVAGGSWLVTQRSTSWTEPLWVAIYPISADASGQSAKYMESLDHATFAAIETFIAEEAKHYGVALAQPVRVVLGNRVTEQPPAPPEAGNVLQVMLWSLRLRYWTWRVDKGDAPPPSDVEIYVRYFDPESHPVLAHSLGLQKGLVGVVNAFASRRQAGSNNVVIAHELLHTLGASDKYDPATNQPLFPTGYAEPEAKPRFPQTLAELMGGRVPVSSTESNMPKSLDQVVIGAQTANEIRWQN